MKDLYPQILWRNFYEISQIPRGSGKEKQIREFILSKVAKKYAYKVDATGNLVVYKPGNLSKSQETIVLQCHLDMVLQKNSGVVHNFDKDPIQYYLDGNYIKARGTTLGADNGIGIATILSILDSSNLVHPPLECLFTVEEETGLIGAGNLDPSLLSGKTLINLDSEEEGHFTIGCSGGYNTNIEISVERVEQVNGCLSLKLFISGLRGGHSGVDIHLNRGNSIRMLMEALQNCMEQFTIYVTHIDGGTMRNAIPREALAEILVPQNQKENLLQWWNHYSKQVTNVWKEKEPDFRLELVEFSTADLPLNQNSLDKIIKSILECPNGVIQWIKENPNIVETSTNIGVIHLSSNKCAIKTLQRSSIEKEKLKLHNRVKTIFEKYGAIVTSDGSYPGWEPNTNSKLLQLSQKLYKEMYKKDPVVTVMHAGLETGVISGIIPGLDMLSIGPTIQFPHSPDERVEVHSVKLFWNFLLKLLEIF